MDFLCYTGRIQKEGMTAMIKLAFFDAKSYDKPGFDRGIAGTEENIK